MTDELASIHLKFIADCFPQKYEKYTNKESKEPLLARFILYHVSVNVSSGKTGLTVWHE